MRGLYIHIPFCNKICPYCHFYSEPLVDYSIKEQYINALISELVSIENKTFHTIYIGGGTPSSLEYRLLEKLLLAINNHIDYRGSEFTIEANPESVSNDFINIITNSSISRISLGVQSFNDKVLELLGRIHSSKQAEEATYKLLKTGKDINMDMIYDIPYVDNNLSIKTLEKIIELNPAHISAYSYDATDRNYLEGFNTDETLYLEVEEICEKNGYLKYETSNFAKHSKESIHNSLYWQSMEYIGVGAASHSMVFLEKNERKRYNHTESIKDYIKNPLSVCNIEIISEYDALLEDVIFGLRMKKGVDLLSLEKKYGSIDTRLINKIEENINNGLLIKEGTWLKTTLRGSMGLEWLSCSLLP